MYQTAHQAIVAEDILVDILICPANSEGREEPGKGTAAAGGALGRGGELPDIDGHLALAGTASIFIDGH